MANNSIKKGFPSLTEENTFWKLYLLTAKIPTSRDNILIFLTFFLIFIFFNIMGVSSLKQEFNELTSFAKDFVNWGISILGFILAGYAIFSSITDRDIQEALARKNEPNTKINYLKHTHGLFVKILIELIILILIVFCSQIIFDLEILKKLINYGYITTESMVKTLAAIKSLNYALLVYILLLCKSFVYNVYHIMMISIRWSLENPKDTCCCQKQSNSDDN